MMKKMVSKITAAFMIVFMCAAVCPIMTFASSMTMEEAEARVAETNEAVAVAQDVLAQAQAALDAASEKYEAGAFSFFEDIGASSALDVLNNAKYSSYTAKGNGKDATSFSNMLASLEFIRECNDLRKSEGCPELKVSHYMMAVAMSDTNASAYTMNHTKQYQVGENLAWGYKDPFDGWYTEEKAEYEAGETSSSITGHYQNIVTSDYAVTGFAMNQYGSYGVTHGQVFQYSSGSADAMSVNEYEKELTAYIASLDQDMLAENVSEAEAALADAQEAQRVAEESLAALSEEQEISDVTQETEENTPETEDSLTGAEEEPTGTEENATDTDENITKTEENMPGAEETSIETDEIILETDENTLETDENTLETDENTPETEEGTTETEEGMTGAEEDPNYGFSVSQLFSTDTFKVDHAYSTHDDGTNTFEIYFYTDGNEDWIDNNITFTVEDVTSAGTISVMESAGIPYVEPEVSITTADEELLDAKRYSYVLYVCPPIAEDGPDLYSAIRATSGKKITVEAGQSTRCIKATAYKDGEVIDYVYTRTSKATDGGYSPADKELYKRTCASIEAQLWSEDMTNLEKLQAFASYIRSVSHYPNSDTTKAEYNPEWAGMWGEDGSTDYKLIWWDFADQYVDWTMALQGGQSTCLAANMLYDIALNDLGLTPITVDDTDAGEGIYVGIGKNSSNPTVGSHYSLVYQAADGTRTFVDAQGMSYSAASASVTCSAHGCQGQIIPINSYSGSGSGSENNSGDADDTEATDNATVVEDEEAPASIENDEVTEENGKTDGELTGYPEGEDAAVENSDDGDDDAEGTNSGDNENTTENDTLTKGTNGDPDNGANVDDEETVTTEDTESESQDDENGTETVSAEEDGSSETDEISEDYSDSGYWEIYPTNITIVSGTSQTFKPVVRWYSSEYPDGFEIDYVVDQDAFVFTEGYLIGADGEQTDLSETEMADLLQYEFTSDGSIKVTAKDLDLEYESADLIFSLSLHGNTYWLEDKNAEWEWNVPFELILAREDAEAEELISADTGEGQSGGTDSGEDGGLASDTANSETADGKTDGKEDDGEPSKFNASDFVIEDEDSDYVGESADTDIQTEVTVDTDLSSSTIIDILETPFAGDPEDVSDNGILTLRPKTGDSNTARIYLIVILIACGGIIGTVIFRRSRCS